MKRMWFLFALFFSMVSGSLPALHAAEPARQAVESFIEAIRGMEFPAADAGLQAKLVAEANGFLDLNAMSIKALAPHWEAAAESDRQAFRDLMGQLVEAVAYPKSRRFMGRYEITYPEVKPSGTGFEVHSVIRQEGEGLDVDVLYHLYQEGGVWRIDDVILDGVSITEDLHYQFDKLVKQSGFSGLLDAMRERLAAAEKQNQTAA